MCAMRNLTCQPANSACVPGSEVEEKKPHGRPNALTLALAKAEEIYPSPGSSWRQYAAAFGAFAGVSLVNLWLQRWIGYQAIALVYLLAVVLLALYVSRGPILFGTALTVIGWNFLFAPPRYSFHIAGFYDKMMVTTYFAVA